MLRVELAAILILVISLGPINSSKSSRKGPEKPASPEVRKPAAQNPQSCLCTQCASCLFPPVLHFANWHPQPAISLRMQSSIEYVLLTLSPSEFPNIVPTERNNVVATSQFKASPVLGASSVAMTLSCPKVLRRIF